eukprot:TRINITY_DN72935_c0_g1_i1.p1 TRINITY_DN72935_c0_g1~~TRINITY_DN72935_c0_g1_i1.p1  ORF type:complete len:370 (+),score=91.11 TRINITY_DN72935_c0_g1_i1:76-1185(+)
MAVAAADRDVIDVAAVLDVDERKMDAKAAGLLKKEQAMEKKRQEAARKQEMKAAEQARRTLEAANKLRDEAAKTTDGLDVQWDVEIAHLPAEHVLCMDIWRQRAEGVEGTLVASPVIMWLHGGGWKFGTHHTMPSFLRRLTEAGYVVASVGYRKSGTAAFPACLHDCKAAVRWLRANCKELGIDVSHIGVVGNSAGAHLATLLGLTRGVAELEGSDLGHADKSSAVTAVVAIAGPADLARTCADHASATTLEALLLGAPLDSVPAAVALASPLTHATQASAVEGAYLLIHGDADEDVPLEQSELMLHALQAAGARADLIRIPCGQHPKFGERDPDACLASARSHWREALEESVVYFFDTHIKNNGSSRP